MATIITPTPEQVQHAKWNQLLADTDRKRQEIQFEPRKYRILFYGAVVSSLLAGAAIFAAGATWFQPRAAQPQPIVIQLQAPK
jgi:hypothetical protein